MTGEWLVVWDGASTRYGEKGALLWGRPERGPDWVEKTKFNPQDPEKKRAWKRAQQRRKRIRRELAGLEPIKRDYSNNGKFFRCRGCRKRVAKQGTRCPLCAL